MPKLLPLFQDATTLLDQEANVKRIIRPTSEKLQRVFLHFQFHPNYISRCTMRNSYKKKINTTTAAQDKDTGTTFYTTLGTSGTCIYQVTI